MCECLKLTSQTSLANHQGKMRGQEKYRGPGSDKKGTEKGVSLKRYYYETRTKEGVIDFFSSPIFLMDIPPAPVIIVFHTDCVRAATSIGLCGTKISPITMN